MGVVIITAERTKYRVELLQQSPNIVSGPTSILILEFVQCRIRAVSKLTADLEMVTPIRAAPRATRDTPMASMEMRTPIRDPNGVGIGVENLISTMMYDHEQAAPAPVIKRSSSNSLPDMSSERATTSLISRLWRSKSLNEEASPGSSTTIRQSHWKATDIASKCAGSNCRVLFKPRTRRRNCAMCGKVFCFNCTNYRRRLSPNAKPDHLGQFFSVCLVCFNYSDEFGGFRNHMRKFQEFRREREGRLQYSEASAKERSLCQRMDTPALRKVISCEIQRLLLGYEANASVMRGLMGDMVIPEWQKSSTWIGSKNITDCSNCGESFSMLKRKNHCRIGGQVFCSKCVKDELLLYFDESGTVKWAINGKDGGPTKEPEKFRLLTVCQKCSSVLHDMLKAELCAAPTPVLLDRLKALHSGLSTMQSKVASTLPTYMNLVECMDMTDESPSHIAERHPLRKLIKTQIDLSDAFSRLAVESQKLKQLRPATRTQQKLLKAIMMGTYRFYSDNMYTFRNLKNHLADIVPMETLDDIQGTVSMQAAERLEVLVHQLVLEAIALEDQYKFNNDFFPFIIDITNRMDVEFKEFVLSRGEDWEEHRKFVMAFIKTEMKENRRRITICDALKTRRKPHVIHHVVVSQCSSLIHECYRDLEAKTIDREFPTVKKNLQIACLKLDEILVVSNSVE